MSEKTGEERLGLLDSLTRLFRREEAEPAPEAEAASRFEKLQADFEAALNGLDAKIEERLRETPSIAPGRAARAKTEEERAAEKLRRMEDAHGAIREDIAKMHERLGTGVASADLEALAGYLQRLDELWTPGKDSHELLPRARYAIVEKFRKEAGELAAERLIELLRREKLRWPDPTHYHPSASEEEVERSRRRRLAEIREGFLASGLAKTGERLLGIVHTWGSDYPERGSALWEESMLEGVAAGIRARLVKEFVDLLLRDRELILTRTEGLIGSELSALQQVLRAGVPSIEQANRAVVRSLRVLDEIVPEVAWEHVRSQLPHARGEWDA